MTEIGEHALGRYLDEKAIQGAAKVLSVFFAMPPTKNAQYDGRNILHTCDWHQ